MKLPVKSVGIFVCGAAIASLPYTLTLGKANAQTTTNSNSHSDSNGAHSSAQASSSQYSSSSSAKNSSAFDMASQLARASQSAGSSGSSGSGDLPIMALSNDDQYVYAAVGNVIYKVKKSEMPTMTFIGQVQPKSSNIRP
ncbi:MAG: hypothetical protein JST12_00220 [Armatimonadetes bacterium]|nr:hypothetical protein [Armatimonadota bacterium]MBS1726799.1 hypothetical protein [Armatimonadota bacterium]